MKSLEEEIMVKSFSSLEIKTELNVIFTSSFICGRSTRFFRNYGISMQQYNVLRILRGSNPNAMNLNDITSRMLDKMSNATRLVEKLRIKGLTSREINPSNRREVLINITEKGLVLLSKIDEEISHVMNRRYEMLTQEEMHTMNHILDKIRNADASLR